MPSKKCEQGCTCGRHFVPDERRQRISKSMKGKHSRAGWNHTEEAKRKIAAARTPEENSRLVKAAWASGKLTPACNLYRKSGGIHNSVWMRCLNSEGVFARQLDKEDIEWAYEPCGFRTRLGRYHPDFYLPEFNIWVEIKGTRPEPKAYAKHQAFRDEYGKCLIVIYQSELESMYY